MRLYRDGTGGDDEEILGGSMCGFVCVGIGGVRLKQLEQRFGERGIGFRQRFGERDVQLGGFRFEQR